MATLVLMAGEVGTWEEVGGVSIADPVVQQLLESEQGGVAWLDLDFGSWGHGSQSQRGLLEAPGVEVAKPPNPLEGTLAEHVAAAGRGVRVAD